MLCAKGLALPYAMEDRGDRLHFPELRRRRADLLERVSWDVAMTHASAVFKSLIEAHGPDSVGFYVSGQCLTEEYYVANKLVKGGLRTNNIDTNSRLCMSSASVAYTKTFGEDAVPICYDDIEEADCFFIAGANPAWCHPILFRRIEARKAANPDVKVIVADPRRTDSSVIADLYLPLRPGTDVQLFNAIARVLIEEDYVDREFVAAHVEGFDAYRDSVFALTVREGADCCGLPVEDIVHAARMIGSANGFLNLWAMGLNQSAMGVEKNLALMALNLITGHVGKPGSGPFSLTGQPNAMGGREVGGMATLLAAHRQLANPEHRKEVAAFWGVDSIRPEPGLTATEMFDALRDGRMKAIWIVATNPMVSLPDVNLAEEALANAQFVVVQDISRRADTLRFADLVLPAAGHFEKSGTMTNSERRITYLEKVTDPPGEALPDVEILCRFAEAMGLRGFDYESPAEIFEEHTRLTRGTNIDISGLTHEGLREKGSVQWPLDPSAAAGTNGAVVGTNHSVAGTKRLFTDRRFYTPSGKARLFPIGPVASRSEASTGDYPLVLNTGRLRDQWHTMTKTGKVGRLLQHAKSPVLSIHPTDASARGIANGDSVRCWNGRGEVRVRAEVTDAIRPGVVFLPMHWGRIRGETGGRANNITSALVDPASKQPDLKFGAVQVEKTVKVRERIAVVGAGAAAFRFVNAYRDLNDTDEVLVFSEEPHPFYDRVRLPEYVSERFSWGELLKYRATGLDRLDLDLRPSTRIVEIDRTRRVLMDERGLEHAYDKLVVATGSRAFAPHGSLVGEPGVFTMRTRADADALKATLHEGAEVLVVGGGLLGLELASALNEMRARVTIVELGGRLMERQLDAVAADLLLEFVEELGIVVRLNDQVREIKQGEDGGAPLRVTLASGSTLPFQAVVYAIGTRPNSELLDDAGVECGRGVLVNDHLQTSDPAIYAIGEIAEHRGVLPGITAAAEEQAEVVARHLAGEVLATYSGSIQMNVLKISDLHLCSLGVPVVPAGDDGYEEILFMDRAESYYKKCIVKDDRLVGAILMGDKGELASFRELIASSLELSDRRKELLRSTRFARPLLGRVVCSCNQVGEGNIQAAVRIGCSDLEEVCAASGAGVGCGTCKPEVRRILEAELVEVA